MAIVRLSQFTELNVSGSGSTSISIPAGSNRIMVVITSEGFGFTSFGSTTPIEVGAGDIWVIKEEDLAAEGASATLTYSQGPISYAFYGNVHQGNIEADDFSTADPHNWSYTGLSDSRLVIARGFSSASTGTWAFSGGITKHAEYIDQPSAERTCAHGDNLATNNVNDTFSTSQSSSGTYTLDPPAGGTRNSQMVVFAGVLDLWDKVPGTPTLAGTGSAVDFSPDGSLMAIANSSSSPGMTVWNTSDWSQVGSVPNPRSVDVEFSPDGNYLAVGTTGISNALIVYDVSDWSVALNSNIAASGTSVSWKADSSEVAVQYSSTCAVYESIGWTSTTAPDIDNFCPIAYSTDGTMFAGKRNNQITIWDTSDWSDITQFSGVTTNFERFSWNNDDSLLAVSNVSTSNLRVYETTTWTLDQTLTTQRPNDHDFSQSGAYLAAIDAVGTPPQQPVVFDTSDWSSTLITTTTGTGSQDSMRFSRDDSYLAVTTQATPFITIYEGPGIASGGNYASTTTATSTVTGILDVARNMIAGPAATATVAAYLAGPTRFASTTTAAATASGYLAGPVRYATVATVTSTVTTNLELNLSLISATAVTSVLGPAPTLDVTRNLISTTTATSTVAASIDVVKGLQSSTTAAAMITPVLALTRSLLSTTAATATVTPALNVRDITPDFASVIAATATVTPVFERAVPLQPSSVAASLTASGALATTRSVASTTTAASLVTAIMVGVQRVSTTVAATSTVTSTLSVARDSQTTVAATSTVTSDFRNITPQFATAIAATATVAPIMSNGRLFIAALQTSRQDSPVSNYQVPLPAHHAGQLLVVFTAHGDNAREVIDLTNSTSGWEQQTALNIANSDSGASITVKIAESSSEVLYLDTTGFSKSWYTAAYAIDDANAWFWRTNSEGLFNATQNPTILPTVMDKQREGISFAAVAGEADSIITVLPTGYGNLTTIQGSNGSTIEGSLSVCYKEIDTTTETPSAPTMLNNASHCTMSFVAYKRDNGEQDYQARFDFGDYSTFWRDFSVEGNTNPAVLDNIWDSYIDNDAAASKPTWTLQNVPDFIEAPSDYSEGGLRALRAQSTLNAVDTGASYIEFTGTWQDLGLPATTTIRGYNQAEIWWKAQIVGTTSQHARVGGTSNGAVEIIDPNGTHVLIPAPTRANSTTSWNQETNNSGILSEYLATDPITIRIYGEAWQNDEAGSEVNLFVDDLQINLTVADNLVSFATTVAATSTVTSLFVLPRLFDTSLSVTSNVTPDLSVATSYFAASLSETSNVLGQLNTPPLIVGTTFDTGTTGSNSITIPTGGQVGDLILTFIAHEADGGLGDNESGDPAQVPYAKVIGFNGGGSEAGGIDYFNRGRARIRTAVIPTETYSYVGVAVYVRFWQEGDSFFNTSMVYPEGGSGNQPFAATTYLIRNANVVANASIGGGNFVDLFTGGTGTNPEPNTFRINSPGYYSTNGGEWLSGSLPPGNGYKTDTPILDINGVGLKSLVTGSQAQLFAPSGMSNLTTVTNTLLAKNVTNHTARHEQIGLSTFDPGAYFGPTTSWAQINVFLFEDSNRTAVRSTTVSASSSASAYLTNLFRAESTTTATSTVTANLVIEKVFASTTTATALVNGNIDETRKLVSATVAQSAVIEPTTFDLLLAFNSTTNAVATVTPNMILDLVFESTTNAAATASGEFFFGYETVITANSSVTADLEVSRPNSTAIAAASTTTQNVDRAVDWQVSIAPTSTITLGNVLIDRPLRADFNGNQVLEANMQLAGRLAATINAASSVTSTFDRGPGFIASLSATSTVTAQTGRGVVVASALVAQSVLGPNPNLAVTRTIASALASTSATTIGQINRSVAYAITPITVTSLVSGTVVVITNTLELTWTSGEYFTEISPCVLQLTSDTYNDTAVVNEVIEDITLTDETLPDVIVGGDDCG